MKREIKFEYGFESVNGIVKKVYALSEIPYIKEKCNVWYELPLIYVRQFAGSKDKNGNDVYEGDIDNKGRICEYFPKLGSFGFKNPKYTVITFLGQFIDKGNYVVGNIYENPELL